MFKDKINTHKESALSSDFNLGFESPPHAVKGGFIILEIHDVDGNLLERVEKKNVVTRDSSLLMAMLHKGDRARGVTMFAAGTGASGSILSPDAAQDTQRALNNEIARKAFSSIVYRTSEGVAVNYPTNIVDYKVTFDVGEAVGALNEIGLLSPFSANTTDQNPILNGPSGYDSTIDVTSLDLMVNYATFGVMTKSSNSVLSLTWRLTY